MGAGHSGTVNPQIIEGLQKETSLTRQQIRRLYQGYLNICSESKTWPTSFNLNDLYALYTDLDNSSAERFAKLLFDVMDADGNGTVDFREYAVTSSIYFNENEREKLTWLFSLFNLNKSGFIMRDELNGIVQILIDIVPDGTFDFTKTTGEITDEILTKVDTNRDNRISIEEFISGASSCATLRQLLKQTLKFARKPYSHCDCSRKRYRSRSRSRTSTMSSVTSTGSY